MKLQDYASEEPLEFEAEFPEDSDSGFVVTLRFMPAHELLRLQGEAINRTYVVKGGSVRQKNEAGQAILDDGLARLITGWRGLTPTVLAGLVPGLKLAALEKDLKKQGLTEIPCEPENKLYLIGQAHGFAAFVKRTAAEAANFQAQEVQEQAKN